MSTKSTTEPKARCAPSARPSPTPPDAVGTSAIGPCPDPESILALFSGRPSGPSGLPLLRHISRCASCKAALAFTAAAVRQRSAGASAAPAAGAAVHNAAMRRFLRRIAVWQQRIARGADALAAAAPGENRLLFCSGRGAPAGRAWKAELRLDFPAGLPPALTVRMLPVNGCAPATGDFVLFGVGTPLRDGEATLPPDILANATSSSGSVAFIGPEGIEIPGVPVLDALD